MILSMQNLQVGMDWWNANTNWGDDLMNHEYAGIFADRNLGIMSGWWEQAVGRLGRWRAYRGSRPPNSKVEILDRGAKQLGRIDAAFQQLMNKVPTEPCIADFTWKEIEELYLLATEIKSSPVFAGKLCHFLFPNLFIVMDNLATDTSNYEIYWRGMREAWLSFPNKDAIRQHILETIQAEANPHPLYPIETKIMEYCHIGWKHA